METLRAYRIVKTKRAASAFDGEGARRAGGRWITPGTRLVYLAESVALAMLEVLVHLDDISLRAVYSFVPIWFPHSCVAVPGQNQMPPLPSNWAEVPAPAQCGLYGNEWIASGRSLALRVPSVVVPWESNFLLNPQHPDFARAEIGPAQSFDLDGRLLEKLGNLLD